MRQDIIDLSISTMDSRKPVVLDQTSVGRLSRMDALQSQAMQLETERRRILEIHSWLRISGPNYGNCTKGD